ncbi:hypothetical protein Pmani_018589, partial [Petrolisthes manimaculis]
MQSFTIILTTPDFTHRPHLHCLISHIIAPTPPPMHPYSLNIRQ